MNELKKTIYVTAGEEKELMENSNRSFTQRILELSKLGLITERIVQEDKIIISKDIEKFSYRINDLIEKGLVYEKNKGDKVSFEQALGYFNKVYKKKYPNKALPVNTVQ